MGGATLNPFESRIFDLELQHREFYVDANGISKERIVGKNRFVFEVSNGIYGIEAVVKVPGAPAVPVPMKGIGYSFYAAHKKDRPTEGLGAGVTIRLEREKRGAYPVMFEFTYADQANESGFTASDIAGKSRNPAGIDFILKLVESAKPEHIHSMIEDMRELDAKAAVALAKRYEESQELDAQFEAIRTLAECEPRSEDRDKSVKRLFEMFSNVDWMKQCNIAKALGISQTPLALSSLMKISGKGSHEAVQQWIDEAIGKYKR